MYVGEVGRASYPSLKDMPKSIFHRDVCFSIIKLGKELRKPLRTQGAWREVEGTFTGIATTTENWASLKVTLARTISHPRTMAAFLHSGESFLLLSLRYLLTTN